MYLIFKIHYLYMHKNRFSDNICGYSKGWVTTSAGYQDNYETITRATLACDRGP